MICLECKIDLDYSKYLYFLYFLMFKGRVIDGI
jgi:hypothetical protein